MREYFVPFFTVVLLFGLTSGPGAIIAKLNNAVALPVRESNEQNGDSGASIEGSRVFRVVLLSPLNTNVNKKGDQVTARVVAPSEYSGDFVLGRVTESKSGGSIKGTSILTFTFHTITHHRETIRIDSAIKSVKNSRGEERVDEEGNVVEKKNNVGKVILGSAIGAAIGAAIGGGKGAAVGAGAGAAAAMVLIKLSVKGANVSFDPGSEFEIEVRERRATST